MLHERTRQYICKLGDRELWEYIQAGTERYEPEAIEFARQQFELRKLSPEQIATIQAEVDTSVKQLEAENTQAAEMPLGMTARVFVFIGGLFGLPALLYLLIWYNFRVHHQYRKARELWTYGLAGLGVAILIYVVGSGMNAVWE